MHARDLVEVAVVVVSHADSFHNGTENQDEIGTVWSRYWTISRCRLERWQSGSADRSARSTAEEVLTSEILTRVWTALLCLGDREPSCEAEPIARNIYLAHQEARNRVLRLLAHPELLSAPDGMALDRLRRRCERWTDLLLAHLSQHGNVEEFAFDVQRMHDFAKDLRDDGVFQGRDESWLLLLASLRNAFQQGYVNADRNADLNKRLALLIMQQFPVCQVCDMESGSGMWQVRLERLASETEGLLAELFQLEQCVDLATAPVRVEHE